MKIGLCKGRHDIPGVEDYVFEIIEDPTNVEEITSQAIEKLSAIESEDIQLYVTGLSVALVAVINAATELGKGLTLYHYDIKTSSYYPQVVKR